MINLTFLRYNAKEKNHESILCFLILTIALGRVFIQKQPNLNRKTEYQLQTSIIIEVNAYCAFCECWYLTNYIFIQFFSIFTLLKSLCSDLNRERISFLSKKIIKSKTNLYSVIHMPQLGK